MQSVRSNRPGILKERELKERIMVDRGYYCDLKKRVDLYAEIDLEL